MILTNVNNLSLPGVVSGDVTPRSGELRRVEIFVAGQYQGDVVYQSIRENEVTHYGWTPANDATGNPAALTTKVDAVRALLGR